MPFAQGVSSKAPHGLISIQGATIGLYTNCQGYYSRHDKQCIFYRHAELFFSSSLWLLNTFKQGIQSKQFTSDHQYSPLILKQINKSATY